MSQWCKPPSDEAVIRTGAADAPCTRSVGRWVMAATVLGSGMAFVDGTVVNVALPVLQVELAAGLAALQWVVEAYLLFLAALVLVGGVLGDRFGRRRIFALGIAIFALASLLAGLAADMPQLIAARALQGIGGALLVPGSLAIISATFSGEQRGRAIGTWSALTALAVVAGPLLGGWLIDTVSWRWIFFINLPPAAVVLVILYRFVPESRGEAPGPLDLAGALLATLGLAALVFGLVEAGTRGFDDRLVIGTLVVGAVALVAFLIGERHAAAPMLPLGLFRSRNFSGANLVTLMLYGALSGGLFFVPYNLVQVQGYSSTAAGAALLPLVVIISAMSRWAGGLVGRFGERLPLVLGPAVATVGFALFALPGVGGSYWTTFFPAAAVLGIGMGITVAPLTTVVMGSVTDDKAGLASGVNNAVSRLAGLVAIAAMGIVVAAAFNTALDGHLAGLALSSEAHGVIETQRVKLAAAEPPAGLDAALRLQLEQAVDASFVAGFRLVMLVAAALALSGALIAALTIRPVAAVPR